MYYLSSKMIFYIQLIQYIHLFYFIYEKKVETVEGLLLYERQRSDSFYDKLMEEQSWNEELEFELRKQTFRAMSQERALTNEELKVHELESQLEKARLKVDLLENVIKGSY
jgi:hypothetical protein